MVHALDVTFDRTDDDRVRAEWRALQDAGLPSLARHTGASNRPHLTLTCRDRVDPAAEAALPTVDGLLPLALQLGDRAAVPRQAAGGSLARHVVVDRPLLDLHDTVAGRARGGRLAADRAGPVGART